MHSRSPHRPRNHAQGNRLTLKEICALQVPSGQPTPILSAHGPPFILTSPDLSQIRRLVLLQQEIFDMLTGRASITDGDGHYFELSPKFFKRLTSHDGHAVAPWARLAALNQIMQLAKVFRLDHVPLMALLVRTGIVHGEETAEQTRQLVSTTILGGTWHPPYDPDMMAPPEPVEHLGSFLQHVDEFFKHSYKDLDHVKLFSDFCNRVILARTGIRKNAGDVHALEAYEAAYAWLEKYQGRLMELFSQRFDSRHERYDPMFTAGYFLPDPTHHAAASLSLRQIRRTGISQTEFRTQWMR
ncbi:hypothetical protein OIV83_004427 [Microbotryomycetes sp. JL201]|nr:hypothetical protein OIV83_004427 [Microbotryomycetes sp. JL201]